MLRKIVLNWQCLSPCVITGCSPDGIPYVAITGWPAESPEALRPAHQFLRHAAKGRLFSKGRSAFINDESRFTTAQWELDWPTHQALPIPFNKGQHRPLPLILDVRANSGGSELLAARFAGHFIKRPVCYGRHLMMRNGVFHGPIERWLKPRSFRFRGPVALLIGRGTISSCESFVLMMKQAPCSTTLGQRTAGASGNPKAFPLGNGIVLFMPSWKDLDLDGNCLEGHGIAPDIEVITTAGDFETGDPVLKAARDHLRERSTAQW